MSSNQTYAEGLQADFNRDPFTDLKYREASRLRDELKALLADMSVTEAPDFAKRIQEIGLGLSKGFSGRSLDDMKQAAKQTLVELESSPPLSSAEVVDESAVPRVYREQYESLPDNVKNRLYWKGLVRRLLANCGEKLRQAEAMPRGAELFGVDEEGKALFRNKGAEPVMFAFNQEGEMVMIPELDSNEFREIKPLADKKEGKARWAAYADVRPWAQERGYEFFPYDNEDEFYFSDEMRQVTANTAQKFLVASANENNRRSVWLESGGSPNHVRVAVFDPRVRGVSVAAFPLDFAGHGRGAAFLLRV